MLELLCVPCKYHGSEEPSSGSGAVRVCVSRDADVSALRAAVAAQLEPKTSGFGPWRQTLSAEPGQIHFFVSGGSDGTELVPVTQGVAQIAQQSSNEAGSATVSGVPVSPVRARLLYFSFEGSYGRVWCCCCCIPCCCPSGKKRKRAKPASSHANSQSNPYPQPVIVQTNQYNYYNTYPPNEATQGYLATYPPPHNGGYAGQNPYS